MSKPSAFTLIELLIVISIIAMLTAMLMPVLQVVQRSARVTATRAVMHKTESALRLFRSEIGAFPYQSAYADTAAGEAPGNRLARHLGSAITGDDLLAVQRDAALAAAAYAYDCRPPGGVGKAVEPAPAASGSHAFRMADLRPATTTDATGSSGWSYNKDSARWTAYLGGTDEQLGTAVMLNRMGSERARRAVLAGHVGVTGTLLPEHRSPAGAVYRATQDRRTPLIPGVPASQPNPGWASDYLAGDLERRYRDGETILDAWQRPLVYVGQVVEGCVATRAVIFGVAILRIDAQAYGLHRQGRRILAPIDPRTGAPLTADGAALPDPARPYDSDRRFYAAAGFEDGFELWSAGHDGRFDWQRSASGNQDNIGLEDYDRGLR